MRHQNIAGIAVLLVWMSFCMPPRAGAESISVSEYRQQVQDIANKVDSLQSHPEAAGELLKAIPDQVTVSTGSGEIIASYKTLRNDVAAFAAANEQKKPGALRELQAYTQALNAAAQGYEKSNADSNAQRNQLTQILARHEFRKVKGPDAKDAFLARIFRWLARLIGKAVAGRTPNFDVMRMLIYLFVGIAITLLLIWTVRKFSKPHAGPLVREIIPFSPSARGWRTWLAEARELAQQQDWRNAIHLAYWAGVSYLEEHGAWKPNRARTPREYLRLIGTRASQYPVFAAMTRKLETVWYGYGNASEADFQEALGQLEKLGCR
jgi:hypothetical protein